MKKIRIGNTFEIRWAIFAGEGKDAAPYNLAGKDLSVYLITAFNTIKVEDFSTEDNMIMFAFEGKDQRYAGTYQMTLIENEGKEEMRTLDTRDAFELVRCSCIEDDADEGIEIVSLSSELNALKIYPVIPEIGENGNWFIEGKDTGKQTKGDDAYQMAVSRGFKGTYDEFVMLCASIGNAIVSPEVSEIRIIKDSEYDPNIDYGNALIGIVEE